MLLGIVAAVALFYIGLDEGRYRWSCCGIGIMLAVNVAVLSLPVLLGQWSPANCDHLEHVGYIRSMMEGYFSGSEYFNPYPLFHILPAAASFLFSINYNITACLYPAFLSVVYTAGTAWVAWLLSPSMPARLTTVFLSTILLLPHKGVLTPYMMPLALPIFLGVLLSVWQGKLNPLWLIGALLVSPLYHIEILAELAIAVVVAILVGLKYRQGVLRLVVAAIPIPLIAIQYFSWSRLHTDVNLVMLENISRQVTATATKIQGAVVDGTIVRYGIGMCALYPGEIVLVCLALAGLALAYRRREINPGMAAMAGAMVILSGLSIMYWLNIGPGALERAVYAVSVFALPLAGYGISRVMMNKSKWARTAIVLVVLCLSLYGAATVWGSAYKYYTYGQAGMIKGQVLEHNPSGYDRLVKLLGPDDARKITIALLGQHWYNDFARRRADEQQ